MGDARGGWVGGVATQTSRSTLPPHGVLCAMVLRLWTIAHGAARGAAHRARCELPRPSDRPMRTEKPRELHLTQVLERRFIHTQYCTQRFQRIKFLINYFRQN